MTDATKHWRVVSASVAGTSHLTEALPCQDAHVVRILPNGTLVIAVADGAGSAARSADGAQIAAETAIDELDVSLRDNAPASVEDWDALLRRAFVIARGALEEFAEQEQITPRTLATTLSCAAVTDEFLAVAQLGDGLVVTEDPSGQLRSEIEPDRGEYANETSFLTETDAVERIRFWGDRRSVRAVVASTDGLLRIAMDLPAFSPFPPFFASLLTFVANADDAAAAHEHLRGFLDSERINARTDDDKTLVIAHRWPSDRSLTSDTCETDADLGSPANSEKRLRVAAPDCVGSA